MKEASVHWVHYFLLQDINFLRISGSIRGLEKKGNYS